MTVLSVSQHKEFVSKTMLTVSKDALKNLQGLSNVDVGKWTGTTRGFLNELKGERVKSISLLNAVIINTHAGKVFELHPRHIKCVFAHDMAINKLNKFRDRSEILYELETQTPGIRSVIYSVRDRFAKKVDIAHARAMDSYFSAKFGTKIFDVDQLFFECVESELRSSSSIPTAARSSLGVKRPHREEEPKPTDANLEHPPKRRKISTDTPIPGNHFQDLNSTSNNPSQFVETLSYEEAELTTLNFSRDDQSWLSDHLLFSTGDEALIPPPPQETEETTLFFNQEEQVSYPLPESNGFNNIGEAFIQPPPTQETEENSFLNQEVLFNDPLRELSVIDILEREGAL